MNLLLISIDSLRLDYVSHTNASLQTPRFDELARQLHFFDRLFSPSSATRPVHASLFTGLYPFEHGILGQGSANMRSGLPHLFELLQNQGYACAGFSEARTIFEGLDFASWIGDLGPDPTSQVGRILQKNHPAPQCLFLHFWSTHTPYGAADDRAYGETARLLASGQHHIVRQRYTHAVENLFEKKIAPLLSRLELQRWCIFIFGDHGESWTREEPYHGMTLRNSVLRVPFYYHIPGLGMLHLERPLLSLIDLFPTLVNIFKLEVDYKGWGRDIRAQGKSPHYLAQIHPLPGGDDLSGRIEKDQLVGDYYQGPMWALFDEHYKFTWEELRGRGRLERTLTEEPVEANSSTTSYTTLYGQMKKDSAYTDLSPPPPTREAEGRLEQRLRDLGYME